MMSIFHARLEARDPASDCFRSYRLEAGPDLFGTWLVDATYGRIGNARPHHPPRRRRRGRGQEDHPPPCSRTASGSASPTGCASLPTQPDGWPRPEDEITEAGTSVIRGRRSVIRGRNIRNPRPTIRNPRPEHP